MEDKSLNNSQASKISDGLQNFIDSMVEEIVLEGKTFDTQKKYLKKFSENEGLDYDKLESDVTTFIEILDSLKKAFSNLQVKLAEEKGKECYMSDDMVEKLIKHSSQQNLVGTSQSQMNVNNEYNGEDSHKHTNNTKNILYVLLGLAFVGIICFLLTNNKKELAPYVADQSAEVKDVYANENDSMAVVKEDNSELVLGVDTIDWNKLAGKYIDIIRDQKNRGCKRCEYFMFDITDNNYPDLFIVVGDSEADYTLHVFSNYTNDEGITENVREIFKDGAAHKSFYKGSNYIIADCGTQGYYERHKLYYEGGKMYNEVIQKFEPNDDWDFPQEPPITWTSPDDYQPIYNANN